jgi:hypothetical protein
LSPFSRWNPKIKFFHASSSFGPPLRRMAVILSCPSGPTMGVNMCPTSSPNTLLSWVSHTNRGRPILLN